MLTKFTQHTWNLDIKYVTNNFFVAGKRIMLKVFSESVTFRQKPQRPLNHQNTQI